MTEQDLIRQQNNLTAQIADAENQGKDTTLLCAQLHIINETLKDLRERISNQTTDK